jgi:hypothetical protein
MKEKKGIDRFFHAIGRGRATLHISPATFTADLRLRRDKSKK